MDQVTGPAPGLTRLRELRRTVPDDVPLIVGQAVAVVGLVVPGRPRWHLPRALTGVAAAATAAGALLAAVGAAPHGTTLTPRVEPPSGAELHTDGAYRWSRHPIYAGLLLGGAGLALGARRPGPVLSWLLLLLVLDRKTRHEEERLLRRFGPAYAAYRESTPRLLGPPRR